MELKELLVVIPHSSIVIPGEIPLESLSERFPALVQNVDWYTNWLYDFRDLLNKRQVVFPYCSLIVEANRHPDILEDSVPVKDARGESVYKAQREPDHELRKMLAKKYLAAFHKSIEDDIESGAEFLLDGHSTVVIDHARGVLLFEDPASFRRTWLREYEFLARWHDLDSSKNRYYEQFGMVLFGKEPMIHAPEHMD
jgi:hypothetical protein